jgi:hypothetical protein
MGGGKNWLKTVSTDAFGCSSVGHSNAAIKKLICEVKLYIVNTSIRRRRMVVINQSGLKPENYWYGL